MTIPLDELNPRQQEAVRTVEGPLMVVAGPGSGKTRVLSYRIAHLIGMGVPAYSILALTFTNKAASEMKERITRLVGAKSAQLWMGTFHSPSRGCCESNANRSDSPATSLFTIPRT